MKLLPKIAASFIAASMVFCALPLTTSAQAETPSSTTNPFDVPDEKETPPIANFGLSSNSIPEIKAGTTSSLALSIQKINDGVFTNVSVTLTSETDDIVVESIGAQTSWASYPRFVFSVSTPASTLPGRYHLNLNITVFDVDNSRQNTQTLDIPVNVVSDVVATGLSVKSYSTNIKSVKEGDKFNLTLTLKNDCKTDLSDVKVTLDGLDNSKFVLDGGFTSKSLDIAKDKEANVVFTLVALGNLIEREAIPVQVKYGINPDPLSTSVIIQCTPKVETTTTPEPQYGNYDISMTEYAFSSNSVEKGTKFNLSFTLQNISKQDITGARVSLNGLDGNKFAIDSGLTYSNFDLKAGESKKFSFPLIGCEGISQIREVIQVDIAFGGQTSTVYTTVTCNPPKPEETTTPAPEVDVVAPPIIIENYNFGGEYVTGGVAFPLKITVQNADAATAIENLKVTISGGAGNGDNGVAFSPANSSNTFFIEKLAAKSTTDISIDLLPRADSKPDSYPVIVEFEYIYVANGKKITAERVTETITIPLQQEDRFTINPPDYPESSGMGDMVYLSTSFVNKGKSGVYNVTADVEGEGFDKTSGAYYVGNVNSGSEEYYDVQITPNTEGMVTGNIVVTYEDANGTQKEQKVPFTINVISYDWGGGDVGIIDDPSVIDPGFEDPSMNEGGGFPMWAWFVIGGGVLVVLIVVIVIVKKSKKKKMMVDDDD